MRRLAFLLLLASAPALGEQHQPPLIGTWHAAISKLYVGTEPIIVSSAGVTAKNWCEARSYRIIQDIFATTDETDAAKVGRFASYVPAGRYRLISIAILGEGCGGAPRRLQFAFPLELKMNPSYKYTGNTAYIGFPEPESTSEVDFSAHTSWFRRTEETPNKSLERSRER